MQPKDPKLKAEERDALKAASDGLNTWQKIAAQAKICKVSKMFDNKFKKLEIKIEPPMIEEDINIAKIYPLIKKTIRCSKPLQGAAPPGDLERKIRNELDKL